MTAAVALPDVPPVRTASRPTLHVDLDAVAANVRALRAATTAELLAVVKADGFGAGAVDVARTALAGGAVGLGVTSLEEALALRCAGVGGRVLSWLNPVDVDGQAARAHGVELAVPSLAHLVHLAERAGGAVDVHLFLDTGLARDGEDPHAWPLLCRAAARAQRQGHVRVVGLMGHLARADAGPDHDGLLRFAWGVRVAHLAGLRPRDRHLAATSATLTDPTTHQSLVRCGAGLVGIDPTSSGAGAALRSPFTLTAPLVQVRTVRAGTGVGYGHTWTAPERTTLGLVPLGYADGLPRSASGRAEVLVAGHRVRVVGRVSMDQLVIDLGDLPIGPGARVTVLGPGDDGEPTVDDWARWADVLPHEVVTGFGGRTHRVVSGGAS